MKLSRLPEPVETRQLMNLVSSEYSLAHGKDDMHSSGCILNTAGPLSWCIFYTLNIAHVLEVEIRAFLQEDKPSTSVFNSGV